MKKSLVSLLCLALIVSMFSLTGCGNKKAPYDYDLSQYVNLGNYMGVEVSALPEITITPEEIQTEIEGRVLAAKTVDQVTEGVVEDGDKVNIDYVGTMDGEAFDGGTAQGKTLTIGSNEFISGFEAGLIGHSIGEEVVLDLTFPDPYPNNPNLSGKPCQFTVKINSKSVENTPEYGIDFVKAQGYNSLAEYEKSVHDDLYQAALDSANYAREEEAWTQIVEASEIIKYPEAELAEIKAEYKKMCESYMSSYGYTLDDYLELNGLTQEDFESDATNYAENVAKNEMVLFAIAHEQGLSVSDAEYKEFIEKTCKEQGFESREDFEKKSGSKFEDVISKRNIISSALLEKVMDFILENSVEK